jgi:hypothetical protein
MGSISALSNFAINKIQDALNRAQALGAPATLYYAALRGKVGTSGLWLTLTAYAVGDWVVPVTHNGRMYRCTTAGTTGASQPTFPTTDGGTVADGTVVWTEGTPNLDANTNLVEPSGGAYARASLVASLANISGTQGAGTTTASSGTSGQVSNNVVIAFAQATADWGPILAFARYDALTVGNLWDWSVCNSPIQILNGAVLQIAAANWSLTLS